MWSANWRSSARRRTVFSRLSRTFRSPTPVKRNRVIHAYDSVNDGIIWGIVLNHLPPLRKEVDKLLG
ncbi:MAG: DUF86 domain-containing protein [Tannerellaceae bacterium]|nr:DUF86 domain-containing protein [Tannerellaceae bacterium]